MRTTEEILEFDKIKEIWKKFTLTKWATKRIDETIPYIEKVKLQKKLLETTEAVMFLEQYGSAPVTCIDELELYINNVSEGAYLTPVQLIEIAKILQEVQKMKEYLSYGLNNSVNIYKYADELNGLPMLVEEIHTQISGQRIREDASKLLKTLHVNARRSKEKMKEKAESILKANKNYMAENFVTYKNGRICVPVKSTYKNKISGSVVDKSSTGMTLFIEPKSVEKLYNELQAIEIEIENEEIKILYTLSSIVAEYSDMLTTNIKIMEKLDYIFSKGKLSLYIGGIEPEINANRIISFVNARHPLMDIKQSVPLNFHIGNEIQGIVITGPNTGGKTICIKTVALNCMMAQCGLHISAEKANICINTNYLCDIGDGQSLSENLSTFSAHITNVVDILQKITPDSFVIMDELGSGTDPTEGMGIAVAILEELANSKALFLVTTHYPEVKNYALKKQGLINARMAFDKESLKPLYELVIGEAGESCAFHIAKKYGMSQAMLDNAKKATYNY